MASALRFGPLGPKAVHLCIDMQTLFAERTDWHAPWLERVLPTVMRLAKARRERSVFTRFALEHPWATAILVQLPCCWTRDKKLLQNARCCS